MNGLTIKVVRVFVSFCILYKVVTPIILPPFFSFIPLALRLLLYATLLHCTALSLIASTQLDSTLRYSTPSYSTQSYATLPLSALLYCTVLCSSLRYAPLLYWVCTVLQGRRKALRNVSQNSLRKWSTNNNKMDSSPKTIELRDSKVQWN